MSDRLRALALRVAAVAVFAGLYVVAVGPARVGWAAHVARPALEAARAPGVAVEYAPGQTFVRVRPAAPAAALSPDAEERHTAPAGLPFALAAAVLLAADPRRPWAAWLLLYHVAVGALALGLLALGAAGHAAGVEAARFVGVFFGDVVTLGVPVWLVFRRPPAPR